MPKGKSTKAHETNGRVEFFEIIQRMDEMANESDLKAQGKADGDAWLGYRGRKVPPGPEMRRGRKSLFDVMRHSCAEDLHKNPTFTGIEIFLITTMMPESRNRTLICGLDVPVTCRLWRAHARLDSPSCAIWFRWRCMAGEERESSSSRARAEKRSTKSV